MNYLNLEIPKLNSAEMVGSDPVERGTWLMLSGYCADQENGGRIKGCRPWKDRMWQQLAGVMLKEVSRKCRLWEWDGDDLVIWGYPAEQEEAVRKKRETGSRGGRPRKPSDNLVVNHMVTESETIIETERKGKEGNGKEGKEIPPNPHRRPTVEQALEAAKIEGIAPEVARCWWETREASGWVKGTTSGPTPVGDNWRADLSNSNRKGWPQESIAKGKQSSKSKL